MEKLYTDKEYSDMAIKANEQGKNLVVIQKEIEYPVEVLEWKKKIIEVEVFDELTGEPTGEFKEIEVDDLDNPIMIEKEIENPETGEVEVVIVQKSHTEIRTKIVEDLELQDNPDNFFNMFFKTSLGYVKRKVTMKDGSVKDFLSDVLPLLKSGVEILVYEIDGTQNKVQVTEEFITECQAQYLKDFYGNNEI